MVEIPWDEIPKGGGRIVVPSDTYLVEVESLDETRSKAGALMYVGTYKILEGPHAGVTLTEYHNIGSEKDKDAKDPQTWREAIGAKTLRSLIEACGLPLQRDPAVIMKAVRNQRFIQQVIEQPQPDKNRDGSPNQFAGNPENRLQRKFRVGERVPGNGTGTKAAAAPVTDGPPEPGMIRAPFTGEWIKAADLPEFIKKHAPKS